MACAAALSDTTAQQVSQNSVTRFGVFSWLQDCWFMMVVITVLKGKSAGHVQLGLHDVVLHCVQCEAL